MADSIIELPNGTTLVTADLSGFPMPPDHPPVLASHAVIPTLAVTTGVVPFEEEGATPT